MTVKYIVFFLQFSCSILRLQEAENRQKNYRSFYQERLFPVITERYKKKYGGSFPLTGKQRQFDELRSSITVLA